MNLSAIEQLLRSPDFRCLEWDKYLGKWRVLLAKDGRSRFYDAETLDEAVEQAMLIVQGFEIWE